MGIIFTSSPCLVQISYFTRASPASYSGLSLCMAQKNISLGSIIQVMQARTSGNLTRNAS